MKNFVSKIVFAVIVLVLDVGIVSNLISCQDSTQEKAETEKIKIEQIKQAISEMVVRHNALTDWELILKSFPYTIELEATLIRSDGRPIFFSYPIIDIEKRDNKYFVHFQNIYPSIRFVLECDSEQVKKITAQQSKKSEERLMRHYLDKYAVIASISSVRKAMFELKANPISSEEAEIDVEASDIFIVNGRCLELLFVGNYRIGRQ